MFNFRSRLLLGLIFGTQLICLQSFATIDKDYTPEQVYKESKHPVIGSTKSLEDFANAIEKSLGIDLELKDSDFAGGIYHVYRPVAGGLKLALYSNYNSHEELYHLESHHDIQSVLYFEGGSPHEQFDTLVNLERSIPGLTFILPEKPKHKNLINVIDLEATCWKKDEAAGKTSEIIEIGISVLDQDSFEILSTESIIVKPQVSEVSEFCTQLTTLTPAYVAEHGIEFSEAVRILEEKYSSKTRLFASYGDFDRKMFQRQFDRLGILSVFGPDHLNVKREFAKVRGLKNEVGMAKALNQLRIPLEGTHHRGSDDSKNIAKILVHLLKAAH